MKHDTRLKPAVRRDQILTTALSLAESSHYLQLTRDKIARALGLSGPAVQYHFGTMAKLRSEIMRAAVKREYLPVIAQGLMARDRQAAKADPDLKTRALESVAVNQ